MWDNFARHPTQQSTQAKSLPVSLFCFIPERPTSYLEDHMSIDITTPSLCGGTCHALCEATLQSVTPLYRVDMYSRSTTVKFSRAQLASQGPTNTPI